MPMDMEKILEDISALPPFAQREVFDFIASLKIRYVSEAPGGTKDEAEEALLESEPFVGMWRDRSDMANSSRWIRNLRQTEWSGDS